MKQIKGKPLPIGVTATETEVNFSIAVPDGKECSLLLYHPGRKAPCASFEMKECVGEGRYLALRDMGKRNYEYNYMIDGEITVDPYAKALAGRSRWGRGAKVSEHEVRGIFRFDEYDWEGDVFPEIPLHKAVAYAIHVRGLTKGSSSKARQKGTFEGVIEKIPYFKELGVNQLHCMPVYEFEECGVRTNYWGYGPAYCFAPKSAYSAGKDAVRSLKDMVKACHREGIEVILEMPFDGSASRQMMAECLRHYMMEYHIDGFILNPSVAPMEEYAQDPILKKTKILRHDTGFQDVMRRFLKGDEGMVHDVIYWLRRHSKDGGTFNSITGHTGFTLNDLVSYESKHNEGNGENNQDGPNYNYSWNCGAEGPSRKREISALRNRQMRNAFLLLLLSQGTPCLLAGDEFYNSQKGNNNVYCQDNPVGWVNWGRLDKEPELAAFVKRLIELRKSYPAFCPEREMLGMAQAGWGVPDVSYHGESAWRVPGEVSSRWLGVYYSGQSEDREDCFVAYNMHWLTHEFALPALKKGRKWYVLASTDGILEAPESVENQKCIEVKARTIVVLAGR